MIHISRAVLDHKLPKDGTRYLLGRAGIRPRVWWYYTQHFTLAQTESEMGFGLGRRKDEKEAPNGGAGRPKETPGRPVYLVEGVPEAWSAGLCPLSVREVRPFPLFSSPMSASQSGSECAESGTPIPVSEFGSRLPGRCATGRGRVGS